MLLLLVALSAAPHFSIDGASCRFTVSWSAKKSTEARARAFVRLLPDFSDAWLMRVDAANKTLWLSPPERVEQAQRDLHALSVELAADGQAHRLPPELVKWTARYIAFQEYRSRVELDYCKGEPASVLERKFEDVLDPAKECSEAIAKTTAQSDRCKQPGYLWGNCVNLVFQKRFGEFPQAQWDREAKAAGITLVQRDCAEP